MSSRCPTIINSNDARMESCWYRVQDRLNVKGPLDWGHTFTIFNSRCLQMLENIAIHGVRHVPSWSYPNNSGDRLPHHHISPIVAERQATVFDNFKTIGALSDSCHPSVTNHERRISISTTSQQTSFRRLQCSIKENLLTWAVTVPSNSVLQPTVCRSSLWRRNDRRVIVGRSLVAGQRPYAQNSPWIYWSVVQEHYALWPTNTEKNAESWIFH